MTTERRGWPYQPDRRERRDQRVAFVLGRLALPASVGAAYFWLGWRGMVVALVVAVVALAYSFVDDSHRRRRTQRERFLAECDAEQAKSGR